MPYRLVASINPNLISLRYNKDFPFRINFEIFGWSQPSLSTNNALIIIICTRVFRVFRKLHWFHWLLPTWILPIGPKAVLGPAFSDDVIDFLNFYWSCSPLFSCSKVTFLIRSSATVKNVRSSKQSKVFCCFLTPYCPDFLFLLDLYRSDLDEWSTSILSAFLCPKPLNN